MANQRIKSVDPDGGVRTVTFDPVGRPNFLAMPGFSVTTIYDLASRVVSEVFQSGVTRNTVYDGADQIFRRITQNSAGTVLGRWTFTYDPVGNRNVVRDIKGNLTQYFNDLKNRLRKDASNGPNAHVFDYGYDSVSDRVTSDESGALATSTFDRAGRIQTTPYSEEELLVHGVALVVSFFAFLHLLGESLSLGENKLVKPKTIDLA